MRIRRIVDNLLGIVYKMKNIIFSRFFLLFVSIFAFVGSIQSQNVKKIKKAGIVCHEDLKYKSESEMAEDNEFNRVKVCQGNSPDYHYVLKVYHHRGYYFNEIWGRVYGVYSVNVYSRKIESNHPIESTHFNYASFPTRELIDFCHKYSINELYFYEDF
ncbi:MAG: hypothetical protein IKV67_08705 [Paludibacteraceae bacterium]|nr:hypothetical protein [Paludibacteraceae bacterium]